MNPNVASAIVPQFGAVCPEDLGQGGLTFILGVKPPNDPMLAGRAAPYAVSMGRRLVEGAKQ